MSEQQIKELAEKAADRILAIRAKNQSGTAWTAPGQGATAQQIAYKLYEMTPSEKTREEWNRAYANLPQGSKDSLASLRRTNLRLIGSLTAEDLKRIAECDVAK